MYDVELKWIKVTLYFLYQVSLHLPMEGFKTVNRPFFFAIYYDYYKYIFEITKHV